MLKKILWVKHSESISATVAQHAIFLGHGDKLEKARRTHDLAKLYVVTCNSIIAAILRCQWTY